MSALCSDALLLQAFAKDAKLLPLLKAFITQQSQLAATPAAQLTAAQIQQLQQVVQAAEVKSPEAFKLDTDQVRSLVRQACRFTLTSWCGDHMSRWPTIGSGMDQPYRAVTACQLVQ